MDNFKYFIGIFFLGLLSTLTSSYLISIKQLFSKQIAKRSKSPETLINYLIYFGIILNNLILFSIINTLNNIFPKSLIEFIIPLFYFIMIIYSIFLVFNINFIDIFPQIKFKITKNKYLNSLKFGFIISNLFILSNPLFYLLLILFIFKFTPIYSNSAVILIYSLGLISILLGFSKLNKTNLNKYLSSLLKNQKLLNILSGIVLIVISSIYLLTNMA